ncbi:glutaconate CoA-transferase subunit B [Desulfotomaculum arcticum]|uniref:Glutaconate CoA-transferase subunit B n=1 Tax=Desulfotruncus arcticus DSM 17038 TaxID=1121424 RepID=A0A1I2WX87_9FIRM|nr:CoA-transferase [Desulfotruncus arcticus]SFH05918.1 glutaconate CoA-transferase subunit B [Desulfotomaculum arcticum] [Desulfotruncus arcticus DSM 17038]
MGDKRYSASELMAITTAKEFKDWEVAFVGIGIPLVAGITAKRFHAPNLNIVYESGCIGPQKYRVDFNVGDSSAADGALCLTSEWRVFSDMQCGYYDVGVLGAAQVDKYGNLNTTAILGEQDYQSPKVRLPGSGGGNDIGSNIGRVVVMLRLEPLRFAEKVDYLTTPGFLDGSPDARKKAGLLGSGPVAVVTDKALFRFDPQTHEMYLDTVYPGVDVGEIKALVGWDLKIAPQLKTASEPTEEELAAVRAADPANLIMGGAAARKGLSGLDEYIEITVKNSGK